MRIVQVYADAAGESHFEDVDVPMAAVDFAPPAPPVQLSVMTPAGQYGVMGAPPGWDGDWHPAPRRLLTVYLAGEVEVTVGDGETRRFGPGDVTLADDTAGRGHRSRVVGDTDARLFLLLLPD